MTTKFIIVGAPRTGSTLLVRTLNTIDGVCCHGELLQSGMVRGYEDGFDPGKATAAQREQRLQRLMREREEDPQGFVLKALNRGSRANGLKALYNNFLDPRWHDIVQSLLHQGAKVIHLKRHNSLRRYISEQILNAGGPIHSAAGGRAEKKIQVHIDPQQFLQEAQDIVARGQQIDALLAAHDLLQLSYEELASDTGQAVARTCRFLGLDIDPTRIQAALRKVGATDLSETVSNYQELLANEATRDMVLSD